MLVEGIKSRPVYRGIAVDLRARRHIFALEGEGALALLERKETLTAAILAETDILYVARGSAGRGYEAALAALDAGSDWTAPTVETLLFRLKVVLSAADMGTRLYLAGTEGFIGQAMQVALDLGMDGAAILTEHRGSLARRVQCVHCKGITENVTTSPYHCSHCGLSLFVRDHYSRRLGAFQGVNIDAEEPGTAPQPEELYL